MDQENQNPREILKRMVELVAQTEKLKDNADRSMKEAAKSAKLAADTLKAIADNQPALKTHEKKGKHLNEYITVFDTYSAKSSDINRSLALAGIAVIWIFRTPAIASSTTLAVGLFPHELIMPLSFLVISLALDLLQYVSGYAIWNSFYHYHLSKWKNRNESTEQIADLEAPKILSNVTKFLFVLKILAMAIAYCYLFGFLKFVFHQN